MMARDEVLMKRLSGSNQNNDYKRDFLLDDFLVAPDDSPKKS